MFSQHTFLKISLTFLATLTPTIRAIGCYTHNNRAPFHFNDLHGDSRDLYNEVTSDIFTTCNLVKDRIFHKDSGDFTHCTEWASKKSSTCYEDCTAGCAAMPSTWASNACKLNCNPDCGSTEYGTNHIAWEIRHDDHGNEDRTLTFDVCYEAFVTELGGCDTGSEQNHNGFWFRIDPNAGKCPK